MNSYDAAIVGGGIIGASIACELAAEKLRVILLDRQAPGLEASWAAAGMLSPGPHSSADDPLVAFAKESFRLYPEFIAAIEVAAKQKIEFARPGALEIFFGPRAEDDRNRLCSIHGRFGLRAEAVSLDRAREIQNSLAPAARAAAWLPDEATVAPRSLMDALLAAATNRGVEIRRHSPVGAFAIEAGRCVGVVAAGERIAAGLVVLAAGCFTGQIVNGTNQLLHSLPTKPVRGQMIALRCDGVKLQRVVRSKNGYLVPRRDGRIVAGSTLEDAGFDKRVTPEGVQTILDAARQLVPELAKAETLESWAGLRPGTPDDLPILGRAEFEGLFAATGHYRNGILLAPATAKLIKQLILGGRVDPLIEGFSPQRFSRAAKV